jgi:hypothetical protein
VIDGYKEKGMNQVKFAIGGAPISQMYADEIGADGYGSDASNAVDLFLYFMGKGDAPVAVAKKPAAVAPAAPAPAASGPKPANGRAKFQVLYWQDIPSEVKAWDDFDEIKVSLPPRFAERIDSSAQKQGFIQADAYMAHLRWSDEAERPGTPEEVAAAVKQELEEKFA